MGTALDPRYDLLLTVGWSRSDVERRTGASALPVIAVTQWQAGLTLRRRISSRLAARGSIGALRYAADEQGRDATVFRGGAETFALVGAGAEVELPIPGGVTAGLIAAYDLHRFTTQALGDDGFGGALTVHRVSAGVSVRWAP